MERQEDRRKNPHNRRDIGDFVFPHESCEEDCPVAIRNQERIATLFHHVDELRGICNTSIKWKQFIWIIGIIIAILGTINTVIYDNYQKQYTNIFSNIHTIETLIARNTNRIDVTLSRFDAHLVQRQEVISRYKEDYSRLERTIHELHKDIKILNRYIGNRYILKPKEGETE